MLQTKTYELAKRTVLLCLSMQRDMAIRPLTYQLLRSGTSSAANYRAALRARSRQEFASKLNTALEEADETKFWCELLCDTKVNRSEELRRLMQLVQLMQLIQLL